MNKFISVLSQFVFCVTAILAAGVVFSQQRDILIENIDESVNPADDFYNYANGGWIKKNNIPDSESAWGIYDLVMIETYNRMRKISEEAAADVTAVKGSSTQKIGDFYFTGMDTAAINAQGIDKIMYEINMIDSVKSKKDLTKVIAHFQIIGCSPFFAFWFGQDSKNSEVYAVNFWQGGIGLPDRDYYFNTDDRTKKIRMEYSAHISKMFQLMGDSKTEADRNCAVIMNIETQLAKVSRKLEDLQDPYKNYNKLSLNDFRNQYRSMHWDQLFRFMNIKNIDSVIVGQPEFYEQVEKVIKNSSLKDLKTYLRWKLINTFAKYLSSKFSKQNFYFYGQILSGAKEQRPRWKRILDVQEYYLGDALGQLYVQKYYSPQTKKRYEELADNIIASFKKRIENSDWLSDATKLKALEKLAAVRKKVGYPSKWKDYSTMNITRNSYVENVIDGNIWYYNYELNKLGKPIDRDEWFTTPQTYNAYYSASNNEILLPAAVFIIPGIPDSLADDALIYGYAGAATIGHEITHGFDDEGRQYDAKGNLNNWWTKEDEEKFNSNAQKYIDQFNGYVALDSMHLNGKATLGENIADLGGLVIGLDAFKLTDQYKSNETISGFSPVQRFFLGYALGWLDNQRKELLAQRIMTDVHSPPLYRVNGPMSNIPEFYEAFNVKEGNLMWRTDSLRVKIW